ncbi:hypothetical protein ABZ401_31505 [Streptomyces sp. NPDC005892]|uniref:hypothetical protein n=1 Tax=Streptomyces sp. NPDC005892 TaxID=3155593 RepID=UPI0033D0F059
MDSEKDPGGGASGAGVPRQRPGYGRHQAPAGYEPGDGCLVQLIRVPVRIVAVLVVLPVRLVRDLLVLASRALHRGLLRPLGRGLSWAWRHLVVAPLSWVWTYLVVVPVVWVWRYLVVVPVVWLYRAVLAPVARALVLVAWALTVWPVIALRRHVLVPLVRYGIVGPLRWLYRAVLTPAGHGLRSLYRSVVTPLGRGLLTAVRWLGIALFVLPSVFAWRYVLTPLALAAAWLARTVLVVPLVRSWRSVLTPLGRGTLRLLRALGHGVVWSSRVLVAVPVAWLWARVLLPVLRETGVAVVVAWRVTGMISRAIGRALAWLLRTLLITPLVRCYRTLCTPVGHVVRDWVWTPARKAVSATGRAVRDTVRTAREAVRQARRDAWHALIGGPAKHEVGGAGRVTARTLGEEHHATPVHGAAPAPEISLPGGTTSRRG